MSFLNRGAQTWTQHSRCGLTSAEYRGKITSLVLVATLSDSSWDTTGLLGHLAHCWLMFTRLLTSNPRSFSSEPFSSQSASSPAWGGLFYVIFKELFSSSSPNKVYGDALEKCRSHPEVIGAFGDSIKGYGEATRRGRRQHVSHIEYVKDGLKHMRLKFYIEGTESGKQGTVHVEVKENPETGKYEVRYIFVDVDTYPRRTIVIEDNR
ncbi:hypothetical protein WISP_43275 [Willisornis vidua]|uniref:Mitochondrial import inner membrane translocase subunit Tim21 n=1 Tax=Willisornis vidua TaxID=1566151 RepID=A0ABQ9DHI1_9PASS|nr:hypothetical protein WISP_43275 [Willisornis vidua]